MANPLIWNLIERFFWAVAITILIVCGLLYIYRGKQKEELSDKKILFGFACFFFGFSIGRIFTYIYTMLVPGNYIDYGFYGYFDRGPLILLKIAVIFIAIGMFLLFISFESTVIHTKYIISMIEIIMIIIMILSPPGVSYRVFCFLNIPFGLVFLMYFLYILTRSAKYELKAVSSFVVFGFFLFTYGVYLGLPETKELNVLPLEISPIFVIIGVLVATLPTIVNPRYLSHSAILWIAIGIIIIILILIFQLYFIFSGLPIYFISATLIINISLIFILYLTFKNLKSEPIFMKSDEQHNVLGLFTRRQMVTEEEISISKEKKICLVCKSEVLGITFICRECKAFYCEKCYNALVNLENACWACDSALDESKSVKLPEKKEEDLVVEEEGVHKKS